MKKAGIITIVDYVNYGNRLQNYAAQEFLKSMGCEVETIVNIPRPKQAETGLGFTLKRIKNALLLSPATMISKIKEKMRERSQKKDYQEGMKLKEQSFKAFSAKHLQETAFVVNPNDIAPDLANRYDFFSVGSDQIWNPDYRNGSAFDFVQFAPKHKRIAFSPSFGISNIPEKFKEQYSVWINGMEHLSVREHAGAKIIKELTGRDATVLVDPTLLLTQEKWLSLATPARRKPKSKYLLTYFIGKGYWENKKWIDQLAQKNNLETVHLGNIIDKERFDADPGEFIDYIRSAEILCTDSFHGIIFAIQMQRPFVVFERVGRGLPMSSRTETLLSTFGLTDRRIGTLKKAPSEDIFRVDFTRVPGILEAQRKKATEYLESAIISNPIQA